MSSEGKRLPAPSMQRSAPQVSVPTPEANRIALGELQAEGLLPVDQDAITALMEVSPKVVRDVIDAVQVSNSNEQKVWDYALKNYGGQEDLDKREIAYRIMLKWLPTITAYTMKDGNDRPGLYFQTTLNTIGALKQYLPKGDNTPMEKLLPSVDVIHRLRYHAGFYDDPGTDVSADTIDDIATIAQHLDKVEPLLVHLQAREIWRGEDIRSFLELEGDLNTTPALSEGVL